MKEFGCFLWDLLPKRWFGIDERFVVKSDKLVHVKTHLLFKNKPVLTVVSKEYKFS